MSRFDSDMDYADWLGGPYPQPNASCADCGAAFVKGREDIGSLCDACCDARDAHTSALEAIHGIQRIAKAVLATDLSKVKDVA